MKKPPNKTINWWKPLLFLALLIGFLAGARFFHWDNQIMALRAWIQSLGFWGPFAYFFIYVLGVVALFPGTVLSVFSGVLFGPGIGTLVASAGATMGAALAFLIARFMTRSTVEGWVSKSERFKKIIHLTSTKGSLVVILVRFLHFPFNVTNYALGLTRVGFRDYVLWSWVCMLPGDFFLAAGGHAVTVGLSEGKVSWLLMTALIVIVIGIGIMTLIAKRRLGNKG